MRPLRRNEASGYKPRTGGGRLFFLGLQENMSAERNKFPGGRT